MNKIYRKLKKYNQEHLLKFYNEINKEEQEKLLKDIQKINFDLMQKLYVNSYKDEYININKISKLKIIENKSLKNSENYINIGEQIIKNSNYGIVLLAGGNASRLGLNKPKGTLKLNIKNKKISLFEIFINELKKIYAKYNTYINVYVMTNDSNIEEIKNYFIANDYFGYKKDKIKFFEQDNLPLLDKEGKILLQNKSNIWFVPNGNGNVFKSLKSSRLINDMKKNNIKYVLFTGIDNPLTKLVDLNFIGCTINNNYKLSSKTIYKSNALDFGWVFCKYNNRPCMLDSNYITVQKDMYRDTNILYHLIHIDYIDKFAKINLKYHRAYKKYDFIDNIGNMISPEKENAFKFEQFIYDAFYYAKDMLLYRVTTKEFCPIKTKEDIKKVEKILNNF